MNDERNILATDIPIALYLNQRLTFDALAALENGFSQFSTVQTTTAGTSSKEKSGQVGIGLSNVFALMGVEFGVGGIKREKQDDSQTSTEEKVHTPTSLFARLRSELRARDLVRDVSNPSDLEKVVPGEFVEFQTILRRSAMVEFLSAFVELLPLIEQFDDKGSAGGRGGGKKASRSNTQTPKQGNALAQAKSLLSAVTAEGSQDLTGAVDTINVVLTTEEVYFTDPSMNDVIDGTFRVFGKVTRVIPEGDAESISLLRKSTLGKFKGLIPQLSDAMNSLSKAGFSGDLTTEFGGPAIQVIPIAIFS